jgi:hypothetical protein
MSAEIAAWAVLYASCSGAAVTGLAVAAKWIVARADAHEAERTAAATFDAHFIPQAEDVARRQADADAAAELDDVIAELDEALGGLK